MTQDHEGAMRAIGEANRTPEFKQHRSNLVNLAVEIAEMYQLGMVNTFGNYTVKSLANDKGLRVEASLNEGNDLGRRSVTINPLAVDYYERTLSDDEEKPYSFAGQLDHLVTYDEELFNGKTREFERTGWTVNGDGSVHRLSYEYDEQGKRINSSRATNDHADLEAAITFLETVKSNIQSLEIE